MSAPIFKTNDFEPILINKAQGSWFWDVEGKKYLDGESGIWCCNLGHNHPKVIQAMQKQMKRIIHRNSRFLTPITIEAAKEVLQFMPNHYDKLTFLNSGSEAVEFAINLTKKVTGHEKVLTLQDSYLGAYGQAKQASYTSPLDANLKLPYQLCSSSACDCLEKFSPQIESIFHERSSFPSCFVFEPVMVSGGVYAPCKNLIQETCKRMHEANGLIVVDEITTGFGRAGFKFGYERLGITPDIIALGKGLGNGYPISAVVTNAVLESKCLPDFYYAQSHQLDPLGAVVAKTVVQVFNDEEIIKKSQAKIKLLTKFFSSFSHPCIKEIRSSGMIFAIQIQPYLNYSIKDVILKLKDELLQLGVMVGINFKRNILRFLPPLTIHESEIAYFMQQLSKAFSLL